MVMQERRKVCCSSQWRYHVMVGDGRQVIVSTNVHSEDGLEPVLFFVFL